MRLLAILLTALVGVASTLPAVPAADVVVSYDGTKVIRVPLPQSDAAAKKLEGTVSRLSLSLWTEKIAAGHAVDIEVPKSRLSAFLKELKGLEYSVMHEDLGESIRKESEGSEVSFFSAGARGGDVSAQAVDMSWFNSYHSYADHITYLSQLVAQYPNNAEIVTAGTSFQGRAITGIHIYGASGKSSKPAIIFHGTVHAREWITTMTTEYIAYQLLSTYSNTTATKTLVDSYDYYIFPVVNPDGFAYSQSSTRLWRKNREQQSSCYGTDINRNWNSHWSVSGGASTSPCAEDYKGPSAGSTPEYRGLSTFNNNLARGTRGAKMFIDFHSYSQLLMYPYGYSCSARAVDSSEFSSLAQGATAALRAVYGTSYTYGPICSTIYQATGTSVDYAYDESKIKYSFTYELRDTGAQGFVLSANQIYPTGRETWESVKYLLQNLK